MGVSLFEHLDFNDNFVELVYQYRMNFGIMSLANDVSYNGRLKCISEEIANKEIQFNNQILQLKVIFQTKDLNKFKILNQK